MTKLKSRKFWLAVASALFIILNEGLGLNVPEESVAYIAGIVAAYIVGEAYVDSKK